MGQKGTVLASVDARSHNPIPFPLLSSTPPIPPTQVQSDPTDVASSDSSAGQDL
jgi:hypothetical protein